MRVSIVTLSYNQAEFLKPCLQSVATGAENIEVEHIVMDGGSTDGSVEILENHDDTLAYWSSKSDDGPSAALNAGFARATGQIYGCLNSDDLFLPGTFGAIHRAYEHDPDVDVIYGHGIMIDGGGRTICRIYSDRWNLQRMLYGRCSVVQQGTFFRAEAFSRAEGFNEENGTCWDAELLVDMAVEGARFRRLDEMLGAFRVHESTITSSIVGSQSIAEVYYRDRKRIKEKIVGEEPRHVVAMKTKWHGARRVFVEPRLSIKRARERIRRRVRGMCRDD